MENEYETEDTFDDADDGLSEGESEYGSFEWYLHG